MSIMPISSETCKGHKKVRYHVQIVEDNLQPSNYKVFKKNNKKYVIKFLVFIPRPTIQKYLHIRQKKYQHSLHEAKALQNPNKN